MIDITHSNKTLSTKINISAGTGDNTIVAAVSGKKIVVWGYEYGGSIDAIYSWKSGSNVISGPRPQVTGYPVAVGFSSRPLFWTNAGEALVLAIGGAANTVGGVVAYDIVDTF